MRSFTSVMSLMALLCGLFFLPVGCSDQKARSLHKTEQAVEKRFENPTQTDTTVSQPYIDIDEWRATPYRYRYVHGGFKNTDTRFSFSWWGCV